jgi:hypothetical protein
MSENSFPGTHKLTRLGDEMEIDYSEIHNLVQTKPDNLRMEFPLILCYSHALILSIPNPDSANYVSGLNKICSNEEKVDL